jgi:hypothetical protein
MRVEGGKAMKFVIDLSVDETKMPEATNSLGPIFAASDELFDSIMEQMLDVPEWVRSIDGMNPFGGLRAAGGRESDG